jgi:hypothetical protein
MLYINLQSCLDRDSHITKELERHGLVGERIEAIDGKRLSDDTYRDFVTRELHMPSIPHGWWMNKSNFDCYSRDEEVILGRLGCYLSHLKALQHCCEEKCEGVIILEDDVDINEDPRLVLSRCKLTGEEDIVYLGGTFRKEPPKQASRLSGANLLRMYGAFGYFVPQGKLKQMCGVLKSPFQVTADTSKDQVKGLPWREGLVKLRARAVDVFFADYYQLYGNCVVANPTPISHPYKFISTLEPLTSVKRHAVYTLNATSLEQY